MTKTAQKSQFRSGNLLRVHTHTHLVHMYVAYSYVYLCEYLPSGKSKSKSKCKVTNTRVNENKYTTTTVKLKPANFCNSPDQTREIYKEPDERLSVIHQKTYRTSSTTRNS